MTWLGGFGPLSTLLAVLVALAAVAPLDWGDRASAAGPTLGGALPGSPPGPLFPADNWWSVDVSSAPVDAGSASYIQFINDCATCCPAGGRSLHPDFGGQVAPGSVQTYGIPYAVVDGTQPKRSVIFFYSDESDGVDHTTDTSVPFYPLPDEAITQPHWVEGGDPASVDLRDDQDRHLIVVDRDNRHLYELWNVWYDSAQGQWYAGSGAFFDMNTNDRRPETWTSADAAGLAILPGLVRYDEVYYDDPTGAYEIPHAFRVTVRRTNGHVYPASHTAGSTAGALPMGARLRLKGGTDISGFPPEIQRIFRAMQKHGLIVADNGTDMYVTGTYDPRWDNDVLNPAFAQLTACDFEVVQLGWRPSRFSDVPTGHPFFTWIEALAKAGITSGCSTSPPHFCPDAGVTRAEMAVFLLRGMHGVGYDPPAPMGTTFTDVPVSQPFAKWIEQFAREGITGGCSTSPPQFCPDAAVTRGQMAVFLLRAMHGNAYDPPAPTGAMFTDVPPAHPFAKWIEQLAREGITGGCSTSPPQYCPDAGVTRATMAVFLVRTFDVPLEAGSSALGHVAGGTP